MLPQQDKQFQTSEEHEAGSSGGWFSKQTKEVFKSVMTLLHIHYRQ